MQPSKTKSKSACGACTSLCVCVCSCFRVEKGAGCLLVELKQQSKTSKSCINSIVDLISYSDCVTDFHEPLSPHYLCHTSLKIVWHGHCMVNTCKMNTCAYDNLTTTFFLFIFVLTLIHFLNNAKKHTHKRKLHRKIEWKRKGKKKFSLEPPSHLKTFSIRPNKK